MPLGYQAQWGDPVHQYPPWSVTTLPSLAGNDALRGIINADHVTTKVVYVLFAVLGIKNGGRDNGFLCSILPIFVKRPTAFWQRRIRGRPRKRIRPNAEALFSHVSPFWCDKSEFGVVNVKFADLQISWISTSS